jgi:hypothetical protein
MQSRGAPSTTEMKVSPPPGFRASLTPWVYSPKSKSTEKRGEERSDGYAEKSGLSVSGWARFVKM